MPFLYGILWIEKFPPINPPFWPALFASTSILTVASILFFKGIKASDLSISIPMLSFTPAFLLVTSPLILGEFPRPIGLIGILTIVLGAYVLNFGDHKRGYLMPFKMLFKEKGTRYILMVALLYSVGANIDKVGMLNSSSAMWLVSLNTCVSLLLFFVMLKTTKDPLKQILSVWPYLLMMGTVSAIAFFSQMAAIKLTIVPYVIAIKRTSVIMTALFGFLLFKEKGFKERSLGVLLMVIGVFIISFWGQK